MKKDHWQSIKSFFSDYLGLITKNNKKEDTKSYLDAFKVLDIDVPCNNYQQGIFNDAKVGDLIYCTMPLPIEKLELIPNDHRRRPYYIAYKLNNGFIAYQTSSKKSNYLKSINSYPICNKKYLDSHIISYIDLKEGFYLPKKDIIKYMFSLDEEDFNQINRRLYINNRKKYIELYKTIPVISKPIIGDVVSYNKAYWLIVGSDDDYYHVAYLKEGFSDKVGKKMVLNYDFKYFTLDFDNIQFIKKDTDLATQIILDKKDIDLICKVIKENRTNWDSLEEGDVFTCEGNAYYCFNKNKHNVISFRTYLDKCNIKNAVCINSDGNDLYIDTNKQYTFAKSSNYRVIASLNPKSIKLIKNRINNNKNKLPTYYTEHNIGTILELNNNCEYVYLYSDNKYYYTVMVNEYLNPEYYENYGIYKIYKEKVVLNGEISDDDLLQILQDQLYENNDKCNILYNKYIQLKENNNYEN